VEITDIRLKKFHDKGALLAVASVQFDNCFIVRDIQVVQLKDKRFISFPNKKAMRYVMNNGEYTEKYEHTDVAHPCTQEFRTYMENAIFELYDMNNEGENNNE
jgi:stage V sporulation protein G